MKVEIGKHIHFTFTRETLLTLLLCVVWSSMLFTYARGIINRFPVIGDNPDIILVAMVVIPTLLALPSLLNKFCLADYLFYLLLVFYYGVNYVFYPDNVQWLDENALTCIFCIYPYYFIGRVLDIDKMYNKLVLLSAVCIYMDLFYFLVYAPEQKNMEEVAGYDNMFAGYQVLPHVAMMLWATFRKFRIWKAVTCFLGTMFILSCGTRGPLVCLGLFGIIYFFFYMNFKGAAYVKGCIIALAALVIINLRDIVIYLAYTFTGLNLSTRILEKFIMGDLSNDTLRGALRDILYRALENGDYFWGMGLFGCRKYDIVYPHYLPLDFICTYGYAVGYLLLFLLFALFGWALWVTRGTIRQQFILFLFSISIVKLMVTNTFTLEPLFYMLIGTCATEIVNWNRALPSTRLSTQDNHESN